MSRSHYEFDKRHYRGVFTPGFFAHLDRTKFWQGDNDPYHRSRRRRKKVFWILAIIILAALIWVTIESSRALSLF